MTTTGTVNLFATAKTTEKTITTTKETVIIEGIETDLIRKAEIKKLLSNLKAENEMIDGRLKDIAREEWLKKGMINKIRPDSFNIAEGKGKVMVIVMDAYKKLEDAKEAALQAYPDVIETKTVFIINPEILEKDGVGEALSAAIISCPGLTDDDKANLLKKEVTKSIKKGTIDRLFQYNNPELLFSLIEPTVALK